MAAAAPPARSTRPGFGFALTEEQEAVRAMVRDFARSEIAPHVKEWDEAQILPARRHSRARRAGDARRPRARGVRRRGTLLHRLHQRHRGALSRGRRRLRPAVAAHKSSCTNHLYLAGSEAQRRSWVTPARAGQAGSAPGGSPSPSAGSDAAGMRTTAVLDGDVGTERDEELHHARPATPTSRSLMAVTDRRGPSAASPRSRGHGPEGDSRRQEGEQAGHARLRHGRAGLEECRVPRRERARRDRARASSMR